GYWPAADEEGVPFGPGHHPRRALRGGQPLTRQGFRGAWAELRGDWCFLREALNLQQHYGKRTVCHLCQAHRLRPGYWFTDFRRDAPVRATLLSGAAWAAAAAGAAVVSPLLAIPGFNIWHVFFDIMHCMDLGILQSLAPSVLAELVVAGVGIFGGFTLRSRLQSAYRHYRAWCQQARLDAAYVAREFTPQWIEGPFPQITMRQAKAAATRAMLPWLLHVCSLPAALATQHGRVRAAMLEALVAGDRL
ncbi:MAG: hypothetical protein GY772_17345, partial [bacterium]|nr:hypothetical protein [bacterium]